MTQVTAVTPFEVTTQGHQFGTNPTHDLSYAISKLLQIRPIGHIFALDRDRPIFLFNTLVRATNPVIQDYKI